MTAEEVNAQFQAEAEGRVAYYATHPEEIEGRLRELDEEWDIERAIEVESAGTVLAGFLMGALFGKKWFLLSVCASGMLLLHNLRGGYPLLPVFRRMGIRTATEIAQERYALKAIRGDFEGEFRADDPGRARKAFQSADPGTVELQRAE
jgi:hypothetical protein